MKKTILLLALLTGIVTYSQGLIGAYGGLNVLNLNTNSEYYELEGPAIGFEIGGSYKYFITDNINAMIDFDFYTAKLKFKYNIFDANSFDDLKAGYTQNYSAFRYAILGNYNFNENFGVVAGPYGETGMSLTGYQPEMGFGLTIGAVANFDKLSIDLRYTLGLNNVYKKEVNPVDINYLNENTIDTNISIKHNGFNIRVTYYIYEF